MKSWTFFWINFVVVITYMAITSLAFIKMRQPNPIGIGLWQWFLIGCHILLMMVIYAVYVITKKNIKEAWKKFKFSLWGYLSAILLYLILSEPIWDLMWSLRGNP